jgi:hypothetical protein
MDRPDEYIQDACGWENCHLFAFRPSIRGAAIATVPNEDALTPEPDAEEVKVSSYFGVSGRESCIYHYDFGDDWMHKLTLEGMERHDARFERRLLDGEGVFPPEDCGGSDGYERCVEAANSGHEREDEEFLEWLGDWHPSSFNLEATAAAFDW